MAHSFPTRRSSDLLSLVRGKNVDILNTIRDSRDLSDDTAAKLKAVVESYTKTFA